MWKTCQFLITTSPDNIWGDKYNILSPLDMAYYLTKQSLIQSSKTMYYTGDGRWSDDISDKKNYPTRGPLDEWIANDDNKSGGFKNATVVKT